MNDNILNKIKEISKKYHLTKAKFSFQINDNIIFYAKHKQKITDIITLDTQKIIFFGSNCKEINFNSPESLPIYVEQKRHNYNEESYLDNKINIGSPKIIFNTKKNTYKISMPVVFDRMCNFEKYNNEYIKSIYEDIGLEYGYYVFESIEYDL